MGLGFEILTKPEGLTSEEWDRKIRDDLLARGFVELRAEPAPASNYAPKPMPKLRGKGVPTPGS